MTEAADAQIELIDPRTYGSGDDPLAQLAAASAAAERGARGALVAALRRRLSEGDDDAIAAALSAAPREKVRLGLLQALTASIDELDASETEGLLTRVFAIPIVFVTAGAPGTVLPGNLPDAGAVAATLREHGALGKAENFGLSATLVTTETLQSVGPSTLFRWTRTIGEHAPAPRDLPGTDITVASSAEHVHLRFLAGAGIVPAHGLSFVESASRISAWGMPVTRALAAQLGREGLSLLPLPRPPKSLAAAVPAGSFACEETRLQLFVTSVLRRLRGSTGDPTAVISAHRGGELQLCFTSPFNDQLREAFRWRLGPFDALGEVVASILSLLRDCRVLDVQVIPGLQAALSQTGRPWGLSDTSPTAEVRH